jgi:hypothetical protein
VPPSLIRPCRGEKLRNLKLLPREERLTKVVGTLPTTLGLWGTETEKAHFSMRFNDSGI